MNMNNKKIVTFTMSLKQSQFEVDRLETEAKKLGVEVNRSLYRDLTFNLENGKTKVYIRGQEVNGENTLGMWFRVAGTRSGKYTEGRNLAIRILRDEVFAANHDGYLKWSRMGKISQHGVFLENDIPVIPTKIFYTKEQVLNSKNVGMFLWQKCLPTRWDLRIIVLDGRAIGAMKRSAVGDEFRSNFSLGGEVEHWDLSEIDREIAEKVAKICGLDYCGVDIMKDNEGNSFVLEVNRQCQFQGFEKSTEINVAKLVVEMFLKRQ
jgi:hypothetical protein